MKRILLLLVGLTLAASSGCASCCSPFDYDYPTFGGKWERVNRRQGRVGSAFDDASQQITAGEMYDGEMYEGETIIDDGSAGMIEYE